VGFTMKGNETKDGSRIIVRNPRSGGGKSSARKLRDEKSIRELVEKEGLSGKGLPYRTKPAECTSSKNYRGGKKRKKARVKTVEGEGTSAASTEY